MFPPGSPGVALLLLRASVAIALVVESCVHRHGLSGWMQIAVAVVALALSVGYLTPIAAAAAVVCHGLLWLGPGTDASALSIIFALDATALALLGPGAYSIDSHRYGRRVLMLPPT
jgi:hypothetical protein